MAEGFTAAGGNTALDALVAAYPWIKLHIGAPGATAANNAATETTRKQASFAAASGGSVATSGSISWTSIAGSQDATHFSAWTASSAGTAGWTGSVTANAYVAGDTLSVATAALTASITVAS